VRAALAVLRPLELVAATDGNHGRALARFARQLGMPAHVFVPEVVDRRTVEAIRAEGAAVTVLAEDYDTTVARAAEEADSCEFAVLV
jgi:diaminopropionate ammonia-lyase